MIRENEIIDAARERAERHQIAEMELHKGNKQLYFYDRIYNSEIASFEAGAKWADKHPKSPWISVEDDLPCNHEDFRYFGTTVLVFAMLDNLDVTVTHMCKNESTKEWYWKDSENVTHWMTIPKLL